MKKFSTLIIICSVILSLIGHSLNGQKSDKAEVMLLGTFHFDNPGMDTFNAEVDDFLSETRQAEIAELNERLAKFNPNKILIEWPESRQAQIDSLYALYLNNQLDLSSLKGARNEIYQVGFKLGKLSGAERIICTDADGMYLGSLVDQVADTLSLDFYAEDYRVLFQAFEEFNTFLQENSLLESMKRMNSKKSILENHLFYTNVALRVEDPEKILGYDFIEKLDTIAGQEYYLRGFDFQNIGVELVAEWYKRNMMIYRNMLRQIESGDRVFAIYGQGHIHTLSQFFEDNPGVDLESVLPYLR